MVMVEPPPQMDDTQPATSPKRPTIPRRRKRRPVVPQWALIGLILLTAVSLVATVLLGLRPNDPIGRTPNRKEITLVVAGEHTTLTTQAATVNDLLREQGLRLSPQDAISETRDTLLSDGMTITIDRARTVTLIIGDDERSLRTPFTNPYDILVNEGVDVTAADRLWLDGTPADTSDLPTWPVPVNEIVIRQAVTVTIVDGETTFELQTAADTVGDALYEAGVTLYLTDTVTPAVGSAITGDTLVTIDRAQPVTIQVDGTTVQTRVRGSTVMDALSEAGIPLVGLDYTVPEYDEAISAGMTIRVLRVTESIISTEETIPYETTMQADPEMELDQRRVVQPGRAGIRRVDERVRYENGIEVGREPVGSEIVQQPRNNVIAYGTNIVLRTVDTPNGPRQYWRKLRVYATSYHPEALGGDNTTAIGATLEHGIIGANPRIIPYRTNVYVPGYGEGIIADTGGARSSPYWIDLGYSDEDFVGWHQYVDIYLLTPVPDNINYVLPEWRPMRGLPDN